MEENTEPEIPENIQQSLIKNKDGSIRLSRHNEILLGKKLRKEYTMTPEKKAHLDRIRIKANQKKIESIKQSRETPKEEPKEEPPAPPEEPPNEEPPAPQEEPPSPPKDQSPSRTYEEMDKRKERRDAQEVIKKEVFDEPKPPPKKNTIVNRNGYFYLDFQ